MKFDAAKSVKVIAVIAVIAAAMILAGCGRPNIQCSSEEDVKLITGIATDQAEALMVKEKLDDGRPLYDA